MSFRIYGNAMKISIITPVRNGAATIADCIGSVNGQSYPAEHIIIDGCSTDGTLAVVSHASPRTRVVSGPDNGIYDAMNKGIALATGDVIGILNADDFYASPHVLGKVAAAFEEKKVDAVFADLVFVHPDNLGKVVRYYRADRFTPDLFAYGWMPPHPTFFVRREAYEKYGLFRTDYKIAADFELLARFLFRHGLSYHYLPEVIVKMRTGGVSTRNFRSNLILNREIVRACGENGIDTHICKVYAKYLTKVFQLVSRPL